MLKDVMIKIVLPGNPLSTSHIYKFSSKPFPHSYMSKDGKLLKNIYIKNVYEQFKSNPLSGPIEIIITLFFGDLRIRDWDNYHKISMDSFNGIVWEDDSQVIKATIEKKYDKGNPRIEILVKEYNS